MGETTRGGEAIRIIQGIRGMNVIGADVVEPMPSAGSPNRMTTQNAVRIGFELTRSVAGRLFGAGDMARGRTL